KPGRAHQQVPPPRRAKPKPAGGEHPEKGRAREEQRVALDAPHPPYGAIGPRPDLVRRLPSRAAVAEQLPVRTLAVDVGAGATFIRAVVPFDEIRLEFRPGAETGQLTRQDGPLTG